MHTALTLKIVFLELLVLALSTPKCVEESDSGSNSCVGKMKAVLLKSPGGTEQMYDAAARNCQWANSVRSL